MVHNLQEMQKLCHLIKLLKSKNHQTKTRYSICVQQSKMIWVLVQKLETKTFSNLSFLIIMFLLKNWFLELMKLKRKKKRQQRRCVRKKKLFLTTPRLCSTRFPCVILKLSVRLLAILFCTKQSLILWSMNLGKEELKSCFSNNYATKWTKIMNICARIWTVDCRILKTRR